MKIVLLVILILRVFTATSNDFAKANKAYKEGLYQEASEIYEKMIKEGYHFSALYYNAGNTFYKIGKTGKAILYFEKARKLSPLDPDIIYNLDSIAKPSTLDNISISESTGIKKGINKIITGKPKNFWSVLALATFLLTCSFFAFFLFAKKMTLKRIAFFSGVFGLIFTLLTVFFAFTHKNHLNSVNNGVVIQSKINIYSEPSDNSEVSFELHEGSAVSILDSNDLWYRIKAGEYQGWVLKTNIEII